jgi:hypothetical protein
MLVEPVPLSLDNFGDAVDGIIALLASVAPDRVPGSGTGNSGGYSGTGGTGAGAGGGVQAAQLVVEDLQLAHVSLDEPGDDKMLTSTDAVPSTGGKAASTNSGESKAAVRTSKSAAVASEYSAHVLIEICTRETLLHFTAGA